MLIKLCHYRICHYLVIYSMVIFTACQCKEPDVMQHQKGMIRNHKLGQNYETLKMLQNTQSEMLDQYQIRFDIF